MMPFQRLCCCLVLVVSISTITSCGNEIDSTEQLTQSIGYTGPELKLPLWAPFRWYVTVPVGGRYLNDKGEEEIDLGHANRHYYSIDFDDNLIDGAGAQHSNVNKKLNQDGTETYLKIVPVLAAATGTVVDMANDSCVKHGKTCFVLIEHKNGYHTLYLHFINESIVVKIGDQVKDGQVLGYLGTTGISTGTHLHFELLKKHDCEPGERPIINELADKSRCLGSFQNDPALQGVTLEGRPWTDYKVGSFYPSTNGLTFSKSASNPQLCANEPTGSAATNWVYTCTPKTGTIRVKEPIWGLIGIEKIAHDFSWKAEVRNPSGTVVNTYQWDSNGVDPWGWDRSYYWPWVYPDRPGNWEIRYYVRTTDTFPSYPIATLPFKVADTPPYTYNGNGTTCARAPSGSVATNWVYSCDLVSTFTFSQNPTVYGMLYVENIFKNYKFVTKFYKDGLLIWTDDPGIYTVVEPWVWRYGYAFPQIQRPQPGNWRIEVNLHFADGTPAVKLRDIAFTVRP